MADKHPYMSATSAITQVFDHLRKSLPTTISADVLKKLGFAPKNESFMMNIIRFLKLIDEDNKPSADARQVFHLHDPEEFKVAFGEIIKSAYADLFDHYGDGAWTLEHGKLITYFRQSDHSSELVGTRQANTFRAIRAYAGYADATSPAKAKPSKSPTSPKKTERAKPIEKSASIKEESPVHVNLPTSPESAKNLGLTVRVEINLPATGDQNTYDMIFRSIRENLLNG